MCGIAGIIDIQHSAVSDAQLNKMADTLIHRGPDGAGLWINEKKTPDSLIAGLPL
jgi:asparagine synthase (glutamine-hydrolysing)